MIINRLKASVTFNVFQLGAKTSKEKKRDGSFCEEVCQRQTTAAPGSAQVGFIPATAAEADLRSVPLNFQLPPPPSV